MSRDYLQYKNLTVRNDIAARKKPDDEYTEAMLELRNYLLKKECSDDDFLYAFELFEDPTRREIVEALLVADSELQDIYNGFKIPLKTLEVYRELFFDMENAFRSDLDKVAYIESYDDPFGKELKLRSYSLGPQFIYFKYGNIVPKSEEQRHLVKKMFLASAYRAMEANFNPINSKITKASMDWSKTMMKAYEVMEKLMNEDTDQSQELVAIITKKGFANPQIDPTKEEIV